MHDGSGTCLLYTWFSSTRGDHFTASDPAWVGVVGELRTSGDEYELMRIEGRVFSPAFPRPPGTVPLCNYWNPDRRDNFLTAQSASSWDAAGQGYTQSRLEGYIYESPGQDRLPLNSYWNPELADNGTSSTSADELFSLDARWTLFTTQAYLLPAIERVVTLNTWYSAARRDHYTTTDPAWAGVVGDHHAGDDGYELVRVEGRVFSPDMPQPSGTLPLWNFWSSERGDNFLTTQTHWIRSRHLHGCDPGPGRAQLNSY